MVRLVIYQSLCLVRRERENDGGEGEVDIYFYMFTYMRVINGWRVVVSALTPARVPGPLPNSPQTMKPTWSD